jgi:hypothetical protein
MTLLWMHEEPILLTVHVLLLLVVIITDLLWRRIFLPWSVTAFLAGLITALLSPWPWGHLLFGGGLFILGVWGLARETCAGGDVWLMLYLGLSFGADVGPVILLGSLVIVAGVLLKRLRWGQKIPLAVFWGAAGLVVLLVPALSPGALVATRTAAPSPFSLAAEDEHAEGVLFSPLPTPTPDPALVQTAMEAAETVALLGLLSAPERRVEAPQAAARLRALARGTPHAGQTLLLRRWAAALEAYGTGQDAALPLIRHLGEANRRYIISANGGN